MNKNIEALIPKEVPDYIPRTMYKVRGKAIKDIDIIEMAYRKRYPTLMVGATGTGKTHLIKYIAYKYKKPYIRVSFANGISLEDLLGFYHIINGETVWEDGILPYCMKNGIIFFADEINFLDSDVIAIFNSILDDDQQLVNILHGKEVVKPHPDFWFVGAMNQGIQYVGTKEMNIAFIDRFKVYLEFDYPSPSTEEKIIKKRVKGIDDKKARVLVEVFNHFREFLADKKIDLSTRSLLHIAELSQELPMDVAFKMVLLPKIKSPSLKETVAFNIKKEIPKEYLSLPPESKNIKEIIDSGFDIEVE